MKILHYFTVKISTLNMAIIKSNVKHKKRSYILILIDYKWTRGLFKKNNQIKLFKLSLGK